MTSRTGPPLARWLHRSTTVLSLTTAGGVLLLGMPAATPAAGPDTSSAEVTSAALTLAASDPHRWPGHPGRRVIRYRVHPGDTATGLAVRFHAWTAELRAINHLGSHARLFVGERIRIPVVVAAARRHRHAHHPRPAHSTRHVAKRHAKQHTAPPRVRHSRPWALADVSRGKVRRVVIRVAGRHGVNPNLALAIAWQESGWQQRRISSAHAIGVMQVLPGTAAWMSWYVGRRLNPYGLYDNVTAGVVLIKVLQAQTGPRRAVAAYYQGLGSVRKHGTYRSTKAYVRNVLALRARVAHGWNPA